MYPDTFADVTLDGKPSVNASECTGKAVVEFTRKWSIIRTYTHPAQSDRKVAISCWLFQTCSGVLILAIPIWLLHSYNPTPWENNSTMWSTGSHYFFCHKTRLEHLRVISNGCLLEAGIQPSSMGERLEMRPHVQTPVVQGGRNWEHLGRGELGNRRKRSQYWRRHVRHDNDNQKRRLSTCG